MEQNLTDEFLDLYRVLEIEGKEKYFPKSGEGENVIGRLMNLPQLREYKEDIREGFGIYKFNFGEKDDVQEIYIGNYKNNKKEGEGMYLKIYKSIPNDSNENVLINFNSGIGVFENDVLKKGKIYTAKDGINMIYQGKIML